MEGAFNSEQLAERYGVTPEAVRLWRYRKKGPRYFKAGKQVYYREAAVLEWEKEQEELQSAVAQKYGNRRGGGPPRGYTACT